MKGKNLNDLWSAYRYGNKLKIVYHKCGKRRDEPFKKSKYQQHLEDLELIPLIDEDEEYSRFCQSLSRTKAKIFEIAMCNDFKYFCTFTADKEKIDRFDLSEFHKKFVQFIRDENKKRDEKIKYLLIPEQHQDGAWHFHGLFMGLTNKDLNKNSFGYLDWGAYSEKFGFFSCSPIRTHEACCKYITKYITKTFANDMNIKGNNHLFYASQGLQRREEIQKLTGEKCPFLEGGVYQKWDFENDYVKILWLNCIKK